MAAQTRALVAARWLADAVKSNRVGPNLRILDASWYLPKMKRNPRAEFEQTHIPGASFFDIDECCDKSSEFDHMLPTKGEFADYVGNLGIGNNTHVVVYDASDFGSFSAPRVWWMFRVFGHSSVSVLDGGFKNWLKEGHPVSQQYSKPAPVDFNASFKESWVKTYEDVLNNIKTKEFQVVDARANGRFRGVEPEPRANTEPGHIPASLNMPFPSFMDPESGLERPVEELTKLFQQAGVDLQKPFWVTCGSGVTACHIALAAHLCGHPGVSLYDGAWSEWFTKAAPEHIISASKLPCLFSIKTGLSFFHPNSDPSGRACLSIQDEEKDWKAAITKFQTCSTKILRVFIFTGPPVVWSSLAKDSYSRHPLSAFIHEPEHFPQKWLGGQNSVGPFLTPQSSDDISPVEVSDMWDVSLMDPDAQMSTTMLVHAGQVDSGVENSGTSKASSSSGFYNMGYFYSKSHTGSLYLESCPVYFSYHPDEGNHSSLSSSSSSCHSLGSPSSLPEQPMSPDSGFAMSDEQHCEDDGDGEEIGGAERAVAEGKALVSFIMSLSQGGVQPAEGFPPVPVFSAWSELVKAPSCASLCEPAESTALRPASMIEPSGSGYLTRAF